MSFNSPVSNATADRLVELLKTPPGGRALDAGCGTGEFLLRWIARHNAMGLGIDRDARCIAAARDLAASRGLATRVDFRCEDMGGFETPAASFAVGVCLGATHAFGAGDTAYPNALAFFHRVLEPGGSVLIGEGYWKRDPDPEYAALLGDPIGIYHTHAGNIAAAERQGFTPLDCTVASGDEWDDFERRHLQKFEQAAAADPTNESLAANLIRARRWWDGYVRWGRETMGFGFYVLRKKSL